MTSKARNIADLGSNDVIETSATGVDVTGTVSADGLTVETAAGTSGTIGLLRNSSSALAGNSAYLDFKFDNTFSGNNVDVQIGAIKTNAGNEESAFVIKTTEGTGTPTERFRVEANGDVSFYEDTGTTAKFVWDSSAESLGIGGTGSGKLYLENDYVSGGYLDITFNQSGFSNRTSKIRHQIDSSGNGGSLVFATNPNGGDATERVRIDSSGNVGLRGTGVTSEDVVNKLDFYSTTSSMNLAGIQGRRTAGGTNYGSLIFTTTSGGSSTEKARLDSSGNLLVGTTSASGKITCKPTTNGTGIHVVQQGSGSVPIVTNSLNANTDVIKFDWYGSKIGSISNSGGVSISYNTTSDERLKENIVDTTHSVNINDIRVREFDWKVDGSHQRFGFIAQELETVYPEAVHSPEDEDEMKAVDYSKIVPLLVKEIQTLKARIETLENN